MPADHPWNAESEIDPSISPTTSLLLGAGNCFRDQVLEVCPELPQHRRAAAHLEGSSLETIRHMVATGLGVTVLPSSAADEMATQNSAGRGAAFTMPEPSRRVALAWRVTYPRNGAIDVLRAAILDNAPARASGGPRRCRPGRCRGWIRDEILDRIHQGNRFDQCIPQALT